MPIQVLESLTYLSKRLAAFCFQPQEMSTVLPASAFPAYRHGQPLGYQRSTPTSQASAVYAASPSHLHAGPPIYANSPSSNSFGMAAPGAQGYATRAAGYSIPASGHAYSPVVASVVQPSTANIPAQPVGGQCGFQNPLYPRTTAATFASRATAAATPISLIAAATAAETTSYSVSASASATAARSTVAAENAATRSPTSLSSPAAVASASYMAANRSSHDFAPQFAATTAPPRKATQDLPVEATDATDQRSNDSDATRLQDELDSNAEQNVGMEDEEIPKAKVRTDVKCFMAERSDGETCVIVERNSDGKRWRFDKRCVEFELQCHDASKLQLWLAGILDVRD